MKNRLSKVFFLLGLLILPFTLTATEEESNDAMKKLSDFMYYRFTFMGLDRDSQETFYLKEGYAITVETTLDEGFLIGYIATGDPDAIKLKLEISDSVGNPLVTESMEDTMARPDLQSQIDLSQAKDIPENSQIVFFEPPKTDYYNIKISLDQSVGDAAWVSVMLLYDEARDGAEEEVVVEEEDL